MESIQLSNLPPNRLPLNPKSDFLIGYVDNKHVFLIDDFADSGKTIQHLIADLDFKGAKTISVVTLFKRKASPKLILPVDGIHYNGFDVDEEWLVGYGLDDENGYYRNLSNVYSI